MSLKDFWGVRLLEGCKISLRRFNFLFFLKGMKREPLFWSANLAFASRVITLLDQSESFPPRWFCTWLREKRNDVIAWLRQRVFLLYVPFPHDPRKFSSRFYLFFSLKKETVRGCGCRFFCYPIAQPSGNELCPLGFVSLLRLGFSFFSFSFSFISPFCLSA